MALIRGSQISGSVASASFALTASYALNGGGGSGFPYSGSAVITGSIVLTGSAAIAGVDYIDFNTHNVIGTNAPAWKEGRVFYDSGSGALAVYNWEQDVTLNVGQEQWLRARNQTGTLIANGTVVKLVSAIGDRPTVEPAQSTDQTNTFSSGNEIIGMATHDIEHGTDGFITTFGIVNGLNTANFNAGDLLWVSQSAGQYTNIPPAPPYDKTFVGIVTRANANNGTVFMTPLTPIHFHDISSVSASAYQQGDLWMYRSGSAGEASAWINTRALTGSYTISGSLNVTSGITGSLAGTSSYATYATTAATSSITYVTSSNFSLSEIEVADYDSNVAVTFVNGRLKFIFGTPTAPSAPVASFNSTFATDRFNQVSDAYTVTGTIAVGGYTLISASLYEGGVLLASTGSNATQLIYSTTTTGSHTYKFAVTASSPLDSSLNLQSTTLSGTLSKTNPGSPTITPTATVQLGSTSNQIEQGATGSISFTSASGAANSWVLSYVGSSTTSPVYVTGSNTGSTSITGTATAYYSSSGVNGSDNNPALTTTSAASFTYTKIRSLRYGATATAAFTAPELENLALWDTTLGGSVGTISKGTTTASGQTLTITWTGDKYHYIVFNSSLSSLTNITTAGFSVLSSFTLTTVGSYKVYRSNTLNSGGAGTSITYVLT